MDVDELRLLDDARAGSRAALGELLDRFRDELHLAAVDALGSTLLPKESGSDVVQDTLLAAVSDFPQFRGRTIDELRNWLTTIVMNRSIDVGRRYRMAGKRRVSQEDRFPPRRMANLPHDDPTPSERVAGSESGRNLRELVERLPELERNVVRLRYAEKLSFAEIATRVKCSPFRVRRIWFRALRLMQREMGGRE